MGPREVLRRRGIPDLRSAHGEHGKPRLVGVGGGASSSSTRILDDDDDTIDSIRFSCPHTMSASAVLGATSARVSNPRTCGGNPAAHTWSVPGQRERPTLLALSHADCEDERRRTSRGRRISSRDDGSARSSTTPCGPSGRRRARDVVHAHGRRSRTSRRRHGHHKALAGSTDAVKPRSKVSGSIPLSGGDEGEPGHHARGTVGDERGGEARVGGDRAEVEDGAVEAEGG